MFVKCSHIINIMNEYANVDLAEDWDNVGLIIGDENSNVKKILVTLDIDDDVIEEAISKKCNMIISHHPLIFKGIKNINTTTILGKRIIKLIKNNINVYSAHTNLDIAKNGTNDTFAKLLNLKNIINFFPSNNSYEFGLGRIGELEQEVLFENVIKKVKDILNLSNLVFCGDLNNKIKKIAICTGAGGEIDFIFNAIKQKCDLYITGDVKYHNAQFAKDNDLCIIDATHYASEVIIVPVICDYINNCSKRLNMEIECFASETNSKILNII